jgi:hypothetical protein
VITELSKQNGMFDIQRVWFGVSYCKSKKVILAAVAEDSGASLQTGSCGPSSKHDSRNRLQPPRHKPLTGGTK